MAPASKAAATDKLDINTATMDQLKALPASADAYRRRSLTGVLTAPRMNCTENKPPAGDYDKLKT